MLGDTDVLGQLGLVGEERLEAPLEVGQPPEAVIVQRLGGLEEAGMCDPADDRQPEARSWHLLRARRTIERAPIPGTGDVRSSPVFGYTTAIRSTAPQAHEKRSIRRGPTN